MPIHSNDDVTLNFAEEPYSTAWVTAAVQVRLEALAAALDIVMRHAQFEDTEHLHSISLDVADVLGSVDGSSTLATKGRVREIALDLNWVMLHHSPVGRTAVPAAAAHLAALATDATALVRFLDFTRA